MDIQDIVNLTSRAWSLPILAALHSGISGRQAPLLHATGAGRTAFAQSMAHLIEIGLIERNPGHGHPLRPEFRLTDSGVKAAEIAHNIQATTQPQHFPLLRRAWTVPILSSLTEPRQFKDIKTRLPSVTDRALSQSLKLLESHTWIDRRVDIQAHPPRPIYSAANSGKRISEVTQHLVED